jgi:hypothetical protein
MGSQPSTQTTVSKVELPEWVDKAAQQNLEIANQLAEKPYVGYDKPLTAGFNSTQQQALNNATANAGAWQSTLGNAINMSNPTAGYTSAMDKAAQTAALTGQYGQNMGAASGMIKGAMDPLNASTSVAQQGTQFQAPSFLQGDVSKYMNPYLTEVENRALDNQSRAFANATNQIGANAVSAGAFGGSRHGIAEGVAASENARSMGDLSAQLRAQGFDAASGLLQNDMTRAMQAEQMRQAAGSQLASNAGLQGQLGQTLGNQSALDQQTRDAAARTAAAIAQGQQDTRLQAGNQIGNLANMGNTMSNQNSALLAAMGGQQREITQAQLQEDYMKWKEKQDHDLQQLNLRLAAVGATPYGSTQTQQTTGAGGGNTGMSIFGSVLGMIPFLGGLSDETTKTDIKKLGKDEATGLNVYAFRYKGDPKTYPKSIGPMAQEVEKVAPELVREMGGKKVVNYGALGALGFGAGIRK